MSYQLTTEIESQLWIKKMNFCFFFRAVATRSCCIVVKYLKVSLKYLFDYVDVDLSK